MRPPIRGYHNILQKSHGWGRHARASPSCLRQQVERKIFCDAQPPHTATFTRREEELQTPVAEVFWLEADSPYGKLQNAWERRCYVNTYFSRSSCKREC